MSLAESDSAVDVGFGCKGATDSARFCSLVGNG